MTRFMSLMPCVLTCALLAVPVSADDPPEKFTPEERKSLETKLRELATTGASAFANGQYPEAEKAFNTALESARRLYPKSEFPDGHGKVATCLSNLAAVLEARGKLEAAEPLSKEALDMNRRLFKGDHAAVATSATNLGCLYFAQGKLDVVEPLLKDALDMRTRLAKGNDHADVANSLNNLGYLYRAQGKLAAAENHFKDALALYRRLYKGDHGHLAYCLNNLGQLYRDQGKLASAEPLFREALSMTRRLFKGDHPYTAVNLGNLSGLHRDRGELAAAEPLAREALEMTRRLFEGDHPEVIQSLFSTASLYRSQGKLSAAEPLAKEALDMARRVFKRDHSFVASGLNNLASVYQDQRKFADAELLFKESLEMRKRLFKGDHPNVAQSLNNLAGVCRARGNLADAEAGYKSALEMYTRLFKGDNENVAVAQGNLAGAYEAQGKFEAAEPLAREALAMTKRVFNDDHPAVAHSLSDLAGLYHAQGRTEDSRRLAGEAMTMSRRLTVAFAQQKSEGAALTLVASLPLYRDHFLSVALRPGGAPANTYREVWRGKGEVARVYEHRQQQVRAAAVDPALAGQLAELASVRRQRAELLLASPTTDRETLTQRETELKRLDGTIAKLDESLPAKLPVLARANRLAAADSADLQKALPTGTVLLDYVRYTCIEFDNTLPVGEREKRTERYVAFVVTRDNVAWVNLGTAEKIETVVRQWQEAITEPPYAVPPDLPAKVRELVWEPVRKHIPAGLKTIYICPDVGLTRVPWAALPGDKPGTIFLEDYAIGVVPHGPFLLDMLWRPDRRDDRPVRLLAVGGVAFGGEPVKGEPVKGEPAGRPHAPMAPVEPKKGLNWPVLPGAQAEVDQVAKRAADRKFPTTLLTGTTASTEQVLVELPRARYAHLATHGFFADASFRSVLRMDPKEYEVSERGERIGRVANSPMVLSGLVLAGANRADTPGRGIVTGEQLIDRDLSGLELAVLSACETALGEVAGGEGVYGLQRAFHVAGTRNVVASLWKVPDAATAALMGEFYRHLWDDKNPQPPIEALRQAQLAVYRADPKRFAELAGRGPGMGDKNFDALKVEVARAPVNKDGQNPPVVWAAWSLSGPGR